MTATEPTPLPVPFNQGDMVAADNSGHVIHYAQYGKEDGIPIFYVHGGPGLGCKPEHLLHPKTKKPLFDLSKYRVIMIDQRGCGQSIYPPGKRLEANETKNLVSDMDQLREQLKLDKIHLFGGSWGSTLSLAYAIEHTDKVKSLTLRGIYLGRKQDNHFSYQGNAAEPDNWQLMGAGRYFPDDWREYVNFIPEAERGDMMAAYKKRINSDDPKMREDAINHWFKWEDISCFMHRPKSSEPEDDIEKARNLSILEMHYFSNGSFFPDDNYILDNAAKLAKIPDIFIVNGRWDMPCPLDQADALHEALKDPKNKRDPAHPLKFVTTTAGHVLQEPENFAALQARLKELAIREERGLGQGRKRGG